MATKAHESEYLTPCKKLEEEWAKAHNIEDCKNV